MSELAWRRFFAFAGVFNLLAGLPLMLAPQMTLGLPLPEGLWLFPRMAGACVAAFGVGYLLVSADLDRYRGVIWVGLVSKLLVFAIFLVYWLTGAIGFTAFLAGATDIVFALFFIRFLTRYAAR